MYFTTFIVHCFINYIYYFPVSYCIIFIFIVVVTCFLLYLHALICYAPVTQLTYFIVLPYAYYVFTIKGFYFHLH